MSHHHPTDLDATVLDEACLEEVTGGVTDPSTDPQLASALQGITSQIASLSQNKGNSGSSLEAMLPMMMMMGMGRGGGSCSCGCGGASCCR
jgi:hypothetical protein